MKLLIAILLSLASPLAAQEFDVGKLARGAEMRWKTENGNTRVRYLGHDRAGFRFAFSRGGSRPMQMTWWSTRTGEMVRAEGDGISVEYHPNDCSLSRGTCRYTEISSGQKRSMVRVTTVKGEKWTYQLYADSASPPNIVQRGWFTVDGNGVILDHEYRLDSGGRRWSRRLER